MSPPATLTGQDVGEAEGALTALLNQALADTNTGITRTEYIALRVLALRGPAPSPADLHEYLAAQPQLGLAASSGKGGTARGGWRAGAPTGRAPARQTAAFGYAWGACVATW